MNKEFEKCLKNGKIRKQEHAEKLIIKELECAKEDLGEAKISFENDGFKWATIQAYPSEATTSFAYYSMFHSARALLFAKGYREKSHVCLKFAIKALYAEEGVIESEYIDQFDITMLLRETADYDYDFSSEGAEIALKNAKSFLEKSQEILGAEKSSRS